MVVHRRRRDVPSTVTDSTEATDHQPLVAQIPQRQQLRHRPKVIR
jgi:hypothetical protein